MLGGTMAHEVAHSPGLADPGGMKFHNDTDMPNHLMDSGFDRPFEERAAVNGAGQNTFAEKTLIISTIFFQSMTRSMLPNELLLNGTVRDRET